jgi:hypothetical protein
MQFNSHFSLFIHQMHHSYPAHVDHNRSNLTKLSYILHAHQIFSQGTTNSAQLSIQGPSKQEGRSNPSSTANPGLAQVVPSIAQQVVVSSKNSKKGKKQKAENENTMAASMCNARVFSYSTHKKHHDPPPHNHKRKEKEHLVKTGSRKQKRNSWKEQAGM